MVKDKDQSTVEGTYSRHKSIVTGPWENVRRSPGSVNPNFFYNIQVHVYHLPGEEIAPGCFVGRRQARRIVMVWAMFC